MSISSVPIILDHGSHYTRVGFAGNPIPHDILPTVISIPKKQTYATLPLAVHPCHTVSQIPHDARFFYRFQRPLAIPGSLDTDILEPIWEYIWDDILGIQTENHPILYTETHHATKHQRNEICEIFFEKYSTPKMNFSTDSTLLLHKFNPNTSLNTGVVVNCHHNETIITVVINGISLHQHFNGKNSLSMYGRELCDIFIDSLSTESRSTINLHNNNNQETPQQLFHDIFYQTCFVSTNYRRDLRKISKEERLLSYGDTVESLYQDDEEVITKCYQLPNGSKITIGLERFTPLESLFNPYGVNTTRSTIQQVIYDTILGCNGAFLQTFNLEQTKGYHDLNNLLSGKTDNNDDINDEYDKYKSLCPTAYRKDYIQLQKELFNNIILNGSITQFPGFQQRLFQELSQLCQYNNDHTQTSININSSDDEELNVYQGAAMYATTQHFHDNAITKQQYDEYGKTIIDKHSPQIYQ